MGKKKRAEGLTLRIKKENTTELVVPDLKQFSEEALRVIYNKNVSMKNLVDLWLYREQDENKLENLILSANRYSDKDEGLEFNAYINFYFNKDISVPQANALEAKKTKLITGMQINNEQEKYYMNQFYKGIGSFLNTENYKFIKDELLELIIGQNAGGSLGGRDVLKLLLQSDGEMSKSLLKYVYLHIDKKKDFFDRTWEYELFINEAKKTPRNLFYAREEAFGSLPEWMDYSRFMNKVERISRTISDQKNEENYYLWMTKIASKDSDLALIMMKEFSHGKMSWLGIELHDVEPSEINRKYMDETFRKDFLGYLNIVLGFEKFEKFKESFKEMFVKNYDVLGAKTLEKLTSSMRTSENRAHDKKYYMSTMLEFFNDNSFTDLRSKLGKEGLEDFINVISKMESPKKMIDDFAKYLQSQINTDTKKTKKTLTAITTNKELETLPYASVARSLSRNSSFPDLGMDVWMDYAVFVRRHQEQLGYIDFSAVEDSLDLIIKNAGPKQKVNVKMKKFLQTLSSFDQSLNRRIIEPIFAYAKNAKGKNFDELLNRLEEIKGLSFVFSEIAHTAAGYIEKISKRRDILESAITIAEVDREKGRIFLTCAVHREKDDALHKLGTAYFMDKKLQAYQMRKLYQAMPQIEKLTNLNTARTFAAVVSQAAKKSDSLTDYLLKYALSLQNNRNQKNNNQIALDRKDSSLPAPLVLELLENMKYITKNNWRVAGAYFQRGMQYITKEPSMFELFSQRTLYSLSRMSSKKVLDILIEEGADSNWKEHPRPGYSTRFKSNALN
ncbi:MAG: hypothetical protein ACP5N2_06655 [Candidatus Nanoarchaeia archaeon]